MVVGVGLAVGVGVGGGTAVGVGVRLIALSSVSAGVMVSGVSSPEPPQAAIPTRMKRAKTVKDDFNIAASPRLVNGVDGEDIEGWGEWGIFLWGIKGGWVFVFFCGGNESWI